MFFQGSALDCDSASTMASHSLTIVSLTKDFAHHDGV
jgi:hypothetical protein